MKGVTTIAMKKMYNTPHRGCIVKTRLTKEERQDFEEKCRTLSISQSEYLRQAIFSGKVSTTIRVTANNEEMLTANCCVSQYVQRFRRQHPLRIFPQGSCRITGLKSGKAGGD
ncbi:MAG: hypothetical protein HFH40_01775 [Lachnospiraceae bacterium]|nr:hypothetical protein [Lachnospiraceae bacterium]